jgi:hypothetical protein
VDFRVPSTAGQRAWLEKALLGLENARVLDVTREKHPPHYHVAVFPAEYLAYAGKKMSQEPVAVVKKDESIPAASSPVLTQAVTAVAPGVRAGSIRLIVALLLSFLLVIGAGPRVLSRISKD